MSRIGSVHIVRIGIVDVALRIGSVSRSIERKPLHRTHPTSLEARRRHWVNPTADGLGLRLKDRSHLLRKCEVLVSPNPEEEGRKEARENDVNGCIPSPPPFRLS